LGQLLDPAPEIYHMEDFALGFLGPAVSPPFSNAHREHAGITLGCPRLPPVMGHPVYMLVVYPGNVKFRSIYSVYIYIEIDR
jgi:hypothetical protein